MIQRIQTIFLFFGLLGILFLFTMPIISFSTSEMVNGKATETEHMIKAIGHYESVGQGFRKVDDYSIGLVLTGFLTAGYVLCIASYKNRKRQIALCWVILLLVFGLVGFILFKLNPYQHIDVQDRQLGLSAFLPTASIIFTLLARRAIAKDEALIRSADRLR